MKLSIELEPFKDDIEKIGLEPGSIKSVIITDPMHPENLLALAIPAPEYTTYNLGSPEEANANLSTEKFFNMVFSATFGGGALFTILMVEGLTRFAGANTDAGRALATIEILGGLLGDYYVYKDYNKRLQRPLNSVRQKLNYLMHQGTIQQVESQQANLRQ